MLTDALLPKPFTFMPAAPSARRARGAPVPAEALAATPVDAPATLTDTDASAPRLLTLHAEGLLAPALETPAALEPISLPESSELLEALGDLEAPAGLEALERLEALDPIAPDARAVSTDDAAHDVAVAPAARA